MNPMMNAFQNAMTNVFGQRQQESANPAAGGVSDWMAFNTGPSPIFPGNPGAYPNAQDMFTGNSPFATRPQGYYDANGLWIPVEQAHGYIASGAQQFDENDRSILELQKTFAAVLHIDMNGTFGISREFMPAFARFCFAWRLYIHVRRKIVVAMDAHGGAKLDVIFFGGASA